MKTITQVVQNLVKPYIDNQDQAVESNIAPVETDATSSTGSYSQGEQLILNKILYDVTAAITVGDPLEVGTNIAVAPKISAAIGGKQEQIEVSSMPTASASNVGKVLIYIGATTSTYTSGQSYQSTLEDGNYIWKPTSISSVDASDVVYDNQTSGLTATDSQAAIDELASQNQTLTSAFVNNVNQNGCKNILDVGARYRAGTMDSKVTIVDDVITVNGAQSSSTHFRLCPAENDNSYVLPAGTYIIVGESSDTNLAMSMKKNGNYLYNSLNPSTPREFTANGTDYFEVQIHLNQASYSNATMKLMICLKSDYEISPKWEPYAKTNRQLTEDSATWDVLSEVGAVNYCNFDTASGTKKGYTFTNDKGVVHVTGSRTSGETGNIDFNKTISLKAGTYKLTGCPSGGSDDTWRLILNINNSAQYSFDYGDGAVFTLAADSDNVKVYCTIMANYSDSVDMYFKPMIAPVSYKGPYGPYAKTNKELTEDITTIESVLPNKLSIIKDTTWHHTAVISCDMVSGGLAYMFTAEGVIMVFTTSSNINMLQLATNPDAHIKIEGSGLTKTLTDWNDSEYTVSRNNVWHLTPITGNWTITTS